MNSKSMGSMSPGELDAYARVMGFSVDDLASAAEKADEIRRRRAREVEMTVLGVHVSVPVRRMHDKRVTDLLAMDGRTDAETERMARLIVGDEAWEAIVAAATEEDGTVDNDALGYAISAVVYDGRLKNY